MPGVALGPVHVTHGIRLNLKMLDYVCKSHRFDKMTSHVFRGYLLKLEGLLAGPGMPGIALGLARAAHGTRHTVSMMDS